MQIPSNEMLSRTLSISFDRESWSSGFTVSINGFLYIITAAHIFDDASEANAKSLYILRNDDCMEVNCSLYFANNRLDATIIKTKISTNIPNATENILSSKNMILGQDVCILGFPSLNFKCAEANNSEYPRPFIKKGCFSAKQDTVLLIDIALEQGFSGGPIVFWDYLENKEKICGIVTNITPIKKMVDTPFSFSYYYFVDAGISGATDISVINNMIKKII